MEAKPTIPVAIWVQSGESMVNLSQWDVPVGSGVDAVDVVRSLPAVLRTLALRIDMHNDNAT